MGATKFKTSRPNWEKICCDNQRGPVVVPPKDIGKEDIDKISQQIQRMPALSEVRKDQAYERMSKRGAIILPIILGTNCG